MQDAMTEAQFQVWLQRQFDEETAKLEVKNDIEIPDVVAVASPSPKRKRKRVETKVYDDFTATKEITLFPYQVKHVKQLQEILSNHKFALDFSMLGSGKTYTSAKIAVERGFKHILVICPVSVIPKWRQMQSDFHLPIEDIMGFQKLRSTKFHQPAHGLLSRRDYKTYQQRAHAWMANTWSTEEIDKVDFRITNKYKEWVNEGLLLIIDEIQNIKNISSQFLAAQTLMTTITKADTESRVLLLSGSPIDKIEHATHIFRALGIMTENRVAQYNIQTGLNDWRGMQEISDYCQLVNPKSFAVHNKKNVWESLEGYSYRLFQHVFKPKLSSAMSISTFKTKLKKENGFYFIDSEGETIVKRGLINLQTASSFDGENVVWSGTGTNQIASLARAMQIIETGKIKLFTRIARDKLNSNPNLKIVIAVNYVLTVVDLKNNLAEFNPLIITGTQTEIQRGKIMKQFQLPTSDNRLLIANQSVISTGIDLDDKEGSWPRMCLVSPNYSTITSYQLGHRFQRSDSKSDAIVHFVYAKQEGKTKATSPDTIELKVLNALSKKSKVMKETTEDQDKAGILFPGDHPDWEES